MLKRLLIASARQALGRVPPRMFWGAHELFVPLYHMVADEPPLHIGYQHHTIGSFERQIDDLLRHFTPVGLAEIVACLRGGAPLPRRAMFVTFDDGLRQIGENAVPILTRKGVPSAIFVTTACVDNRALMYPHLATLIVDRLERGVTDAARREIAGVLGCDDGKIEQAVGAVGYDDRRQLDRIAVIAGIDVADYLARARPYQTRDELARLGAGGVVLGGHSIDHPKYRGLSDDERIRQTETCMQFVVEQFAPPVRAFAFPFGDLGVTARFFQEMVGAGTFEISFGTARLREDVPGHIQRLPMDEGRGPTDRILSRAYSERWGRRVAGRNRLRRA